MIPLTARKLREAAFFCFRLEAAHQQPILDSVELLAGASHFEDPFHPEELSYWLSAFLSAARSVTFALQAEQKDPYDKWFPNWLARQTETDRALLNFLKEQRNVEQKRGGATVVPGIRETVLGGGDDAEEALLAIRRAALFFEVDDPVEDVAASCRRYLTLLEALVNDFVRENS